MPTSALKWLVSQPDSAVSNGEAFLEVDQIQYLTGNGAHISDPWQGMLVKRDLNVVLEKIIVSLKDELEFAFDKRFGTDEEIWRELNVLETMQMVVGQAAGRFTVGLPLCTFTKSHQLQRDFTDTLLGRNEKYLHANLKFANHFVMTASLCGGSPKFLRPFIGALLSIPNSLLMSRFGGMWKSLYEERLAIVKAGPKADNDPTDHIQMMFRYAQSERPHELNHKNMTGRLAMANFGSGHQTSIGITNIIFNVLDSDAEFNTIAILREEIRSVVGENKDWTKATVAKLVRCDSVLKETLRLHSFGNRTPIRKVMVDGLVTEEGIALPKNSIVSFLLTSQIDGETFEDPEKFDPFRFSRIREQEGNEQGGLSFVSTGKDFLPFGHGKHACPGRFLLDFELKIILAYLLNNYDIELAPIHKGKRPESKWLAEAIFPPADGRIRVKRRHT